jgi:hypothetical protein
MVKPQKKKPKLEEIELHPDAWERFEDFVDTKVRTSAAPAKKPTASRPKATSRKPTKKD